ncbi:ADP-ribosylation factor-like protein 15 isoform X4 [Rhinatrema bivittatum]|uniref:ADP-ribosylation factor-like protein 15 isoform X4 n=1 Tax=Rhinatrema bivittatum TaxID=194408 RepID=UPI001125C3E1|nr:ADP-ribosylation factor-like protein 15 isoform X4 [Rhinatrema bivittatum]
MDYLSLCERIQLSFAVCRIGIYTNSGTHLCAHRIGQTAANFIFFNGCFRTLCCKGPPPPRPEYDVVCVGLMGSGKTSLLTHLCSESPDNIVPTTGFSIKAVPFQNAILNVKELGGAANIRKYWSRYYQGSQGVIFVLDSATSEDDLEIARNELHSALQHPQLCTLPFLILAHHQDKPAARSVQERVVSPTVVSGIREPNKCRQHLLCCKSQLFNVQLFVVGKAEACFVEVAKNNSIQLET